MKKLVLSFVALLFAICSCFGQHLNDSATTNDYDFYKAKAKRQTTTGVVLLSAGLLTTGIATISALDHLFSTPPAGTTVAFFGGLGMTVTGVAFLLVSDQTNRKARKLKTAFKMENTSTITGAFITTHYYPVASLKWSL